MKVAESIHTQNHTQLIRQTCYVNYEYPWGFNVNACNCLITCVGKIVWVFYQSHMEGGGEKTDL